MWAELQGVTFAVVVDATSVTLDVVVTGPSLDGIGIYRPSAAALFFPSENGEEPHRPDTSAVLNGEEALSFDAPGLVVDSSNLEGLDRILMTALHGTAPHRISVDPLLGPLWQISTCTHLDPVQCESLGWTPRISGHTAIQEDPLDWTAWLEDPAQDQLLLIRLEVSYPGEEGRALYDHAYIDYRAD